jgi:hypothetical protein
METATKSNVLRAGTSRAPVVRRRTLHLFAIRLAEQRQARQPGLALAPHAMPPELGMHQQMNVLRQKISNLSNNIATRQVHQCKRSYAINWAPRIKKRSSLISDY